ncbi:MAG: hypothetical protein ACE5ES_05605 [Candidatus Nanoarchaeia archaeon]
MNIKILKQKIAKIKITEKIPCSNENAIEIYYLLIISKIEDGNTIQVDYDWFNQKEVFKIREELIAAIE